jgi:hypothetical protein
MACGQSRLGVDYPASQVLPSSTATLMRPGYCREGIPCAQNVLAIRREPVSAMSLLQPACFKHAGEDAK